MFKVVSLTISFFLLFLSNSFAQLKTYEFDAKIEDTQTVNAELTSALDEAGNTHIAWFETDENNRTLMYSIFDGTAVSTTTIQSFPNGMPVAPQITLDENDNPHIVFILKRDKDAGRRTGNYAILYAGDGDGNGTFDVSQVSTNPEDPSDDTESEFDSYINGRPTITINSSGQITIYYTTNSYSENGYDNHVARAVYSGESWSRSIMFNADDFVEGTFDIDEDFISPPNQGTESYLATIDISDYRPQFFYNSNGEWSKTILSEFAGVFNNKDVRLVKTNSGNTFMLWRNEEEEDQFVYTKLSGGNYSEPVIAATKESVSGNLNGYTVDRVTEDVYFYYNRSFSSNSYLLTFDKNEAPYEVTLSEIGAVYGKRSLHANNGYLSLVTASESDGKIYITYGTLDGDSKESSLTTSNIDYPVDNLCKPFSYTGKIDGENGSQGTLKVECDYQNGDLSVDSLTLNYEMGVFFGEPTRSAVFKWEGSGNLFDVKWGAAVVNSDEEQYLIDGNPVYVSWEEGTFNGPGEGYGSDVSGSPNWDKTFLFFDSDSVAFKDSVTEEMAKEIYNRDFMLKDLFVLEINDSSIDSSDNGSEKELLALFSADTTNIVTGATIQFKNESEGDITSRTWTFEGGIPETSTDVNPVITYNEEGSFDVTLVVQSSTTSDTLIRRNYIQVIKVAASDTAIHFSDNFDSELIDDSKWPYVANDEENSWYLGNPEESFSDINSENVYSMMAQSDGEEALYLQSENFMIPDSNMIFSVWMYIDDPDNFSSTTSDISIYMGAEGSASPMWSYYGESTLSAGWNHLKIDVDEEELIQEYFGQEGFIYFRYYGTNNALVAIDDFKFYTTASDDDTGTGLDERSDNDISGFELAQNYPNPFNPTTVISYEVQEASLVKLQVFDVLGRHIETLVNEPKNPGVYQQIFDASDLPSGIYMYKLTASSKSDIKKMLLIK